MYITNLQVKITSSLYVGKKTGFLLETRHFFVWHLLCKTMTEIV